MKMIKKIFSALGTINTITVFCDENEIKDVKNTLNKIENYVNELDDKISIFKETSEVSIINKNAGYKPIFVSKDTFDLIKISRKFSRLTKGTFDITTKPLNDIAKRKNKDIKNLKTDYININYKDIVLSSKNKTVMLKHKKQGIDLGGIAKGFAIDKIKNILDENNIKNAIIDLGGTILNIGEEREVGIRNPFVPINKNKKEEKVISLMNKNSIIVTSGLYEQEHHIVNPKTKKIVNTDIISVTVIGNSGALQDVIATSCFILDIKKSVKLLKMFNLQAIFIYKNGNIFITDKIKNKVRMDV